MAASNSLEHGDMERLTLLWRSRPELLRQAIRAARTQYQVTPKPARSLDPGEYLLGESRGGTPLVGVVLAEVLTTAAGTTAIEQAARFIQANLAALTGKKHRKKGPAAARLEVFLPPDAFTDRPTSIGGIPVEWFRWIPEDEHLIRLEELASSGAAHVGTSGDGPTEGVVPRLLQHLAWWEQALRDRTSIETPYRQALLAFNIAVLLDWHLTLPDQGSLDQLPDAKASKTARNAVSSFFDAARGCVEKLDGSTSGKPEKQLRKLAAASERLLKKFAKLRGSEVTPERHTEFEQPIRPAELISAWLENNKAPSGDRSSPAGAHPGDLYEPSSPASRVLSTLVPVLAAQKLFEEGGLTPAAYTAVRETSAEFLEPVIDNAASSSRGEDKKIWRRVGRPVVKALRTPVTPSSPRAGR
jgi:hypothetical protein